MHIILSPSSVHFLGLHIKLGIQLFRSRGRTSIKKILYLPTPFGRQISLVQWNPQTQSSQRNYCAHLECAQIHQLTTKCRHRDEHAVVLYNYSDIPLEQHNNNITMEQTSRRVRPLMQGAQRRSSLVSVLA